MSMSAKTQTNSLVTELLSLNSEDSFLPEDSGQSIPGLAKQLLLLPEKKPKAQD